MPWFGTFCHRLVLKMLRWRVILRSHPLRVRFGLPLLVSVVLVLTFRHYLWIHVPIWVSTISHPIFIAAQTHSIFRRILHVLFNAIPDIAFALLAVAGLAYLVPKRYLDKIEELVWVRRFLLVLFVTVGFSAIIINAIKNENQEFKDGQNDERMGVVLKSVLNIQDALKPKAVNLTEAERKERLLESLRDEYVASHSSIDPSIVTGKKMPPDDWMNMRLSQMGEKWRQLTPVATAPYSAAAPASKPDISVAIVYPNEIALLLSNNSEAAVREINVLLLLWDLDNPGNPPNNLQIPINLKDTVIQKHTYLIPLSLAGNSAVKNQIKQGDRIFGFITIGCGECIDAKEVWVYAVQGNGGWYHQVAKGEAKPLMNAIGKNLKDITARTDVYLNQIVPPDKRTPIQDVP